MPKYDFAHPTFKNGFVEFPVKKESLFDYFCQQAPRYRVNVIKSQMVVSAKNYMAKIFNRMSYIELRKDGKPTFLHTKNDVLNFFEELKK